MKKFFDLMMSVFALDDISGVRCFGGFSCVVDL